MKNQKKQCFAKLIVPKIIQYNENEKNESPSSDTKISVNSIIKPKPLNINLNTEINTKLLCKNDELIRPKYGKTFNMFDKSFSK